MLETGGVVCPQAGKAGTDKYKKPPLREAFEVKQFTTANKNEKKEPPLRHYHFERVA